MQGEGQGGGQQPQRHTHDQGVQRVYLGGDGLAPQRAGEAHDNGPQHGRFRLTPQLPQKFEEKNEGNGGQNGRAHIDPPGHRANRHQAEQLAQQQVERITRRVGNAQLRRHHLKLKRIRLPHRARHRAQVDRQQGRGHQQRPQPEPGIGLPAPAPPGPQQQHQPQRRAKNEPAAPQIHQRIGQVDEVEQQRRQRQGGELPLRPALPDQPGGKGKDSSEGEGEQRPSQPQPAWKQPLVQNAAGRQPANKGEKKEGKMGGEIGQAGRIKGEWRLVFGVHRCLLYPFLHDPGNNSEHLLCLGNRPRINADSKTALQIVERL